jgi:hypothetical protein
MSFKILCLLMFILLCTATMARTAVNTESSGTSSKEKTMNCMSNTIKSNPTFIGDPVPGGGTPRATNQTGNQTWT